jgi:hypothetical protein
VPDITAVYLPGPDHYAHVNGVERGGLGSAAGTVRKYLVEGLDKRLATLYDGVRDRGYEFATFYVLVSDHGEVGLRTGGPEADKYRPLLHKDSGKVTDPGTEELLGVLNQTSYHDKTYTGAELMQRSVVFSPNGGLSHIYLRGAETNWSGPGTAPANSAILEVAQALFEANEGSADGNVRGAMAAVLVKAQEEGEVQNSFLLDYKVFTLIKVTDPDGGVVYKPRLLELASLPATWPEIASRVGFLNDKTAKGSNSGDIVVIWKTAEGYSSEYGKNHGSHGGVTQAEVEVPLIFSSVLMQRPLVADPNDPKASERVAHNVGFVQTARDAVRALPERTVPSNSDLTPILLEALRAAKGGN